MYYCNNCKGYIEELEERSENLGECHGRPAWRDYKACPDCGSDDVEECKKCLICGEYFAPDRVEEICSDCMQIMDVELLDIQKRYGVTRDELETWIVEFFGW